MLLDMSTGEALQERQLLLGQDATVDEDPAQWPMFHLRPGLEGRDQVGLIGQAVLERQHDKQQVLLDFELRYDIRPFVKPLIPGSSRYRHSAILRMSSLVQPL